MQLVLPDKLLPITIYYHDINFWVEVISIIVFFIGGCVLLKRKPNELDTHKHIKIGYAMFAWFFALCRIFFILGVWFPGSSSSTTILGITFPPNFDLYEFFTVIGYVWSAIGMSSVIFVLEKYLITKTHRFFTILAILLDCIYSLTVVLMGMQIQSFFGRDFALLLSDVMSPVLTAVILILYIYLAVKGTATLRRNAILIIIAIGFIGIATILDGESMVANAATWFPLNSLTLDIYYACAPGVMTIGIIIFVKVTY